MLMNIKRKIEEDRKKKLFAPLLLQPKQENN